MISLICEILNVIQRTYLQYRNGLTDPENRVVVAKGEGSGGKMDQEFGISRCKLLYIGWINNRSYSIAQGTIFNIQRI